MNLDIQHVHLHLDFDGGVTAKLDQILTLTSAIQAQGERMAVDFTNARAVLDQINLTTNEMAGAIDSVIATDAAEDQAFQAEIDRLKAIIAAGDAVTQADLDALTTGLGEPNAKLVALRDALQSIAANPTNPTLTVKLK